MKKNWKKYVVIIVLLIVTLWVVRNKYFYNRLFSEEFCNSIVELQYVSYGNEIRTYEITDEKIIRKFADVLYNNKYKKLPAISEGGYTFKLLMEDDEYTIVMGGMSIGWKGKEYEAKEDFFEILQEIMDYLEIE